MKVDATDSATHAGHVENKQPENAGNDTDKASDSRTAGNDARDADAKLLQDVKDLLKELGIELPGEEEGAKAEGSANPETGGAKSSPAPAKAEPPANKATEDKQPSREELIDLIAKALNVSKAEAEKALDSLSDDGKDDAAANPRVGTQNALLG
jgi:NACalpha-BTF3-like transcription factor